MALVETAASGDRVAALKDTRDLLAHAIASCDSLRDLASLVGRFQAVLAEIAELDPKQLEVDDVDEIAGRRNARRAGSTKGAARSKRSG